MSPDDLAFWFEVAGKIALYASLLPAVGACAARLVLVPRLRLDDRDRVEIDARLARVGALTTALVLCALLLRLATHTIAVFGIPDALSVSQIRTVALESRWGGGWRVQAIAVAAWLAVAILGRVRPRMGAVLSALAAIVVCYSIPLVGHAARNPWRIALHGSHVVGAGVWLGTLAVIVLVGFGDGEAGRSDGRGSARRRAMLQAFAPIALSGAAALLLTGGTMAYLYVGSLSSLWTTPYGRLLDMKVLLVGGAAACGFVNWRRFAAERSGRTLAEFSPSTAMIVEVLFAVAVVLVTAVLTETGHP